MLSQPGGFIPPALFAVRVRPTVDLETNHVGTAASAVRRAKLDLLALRCRRSRPKGELMLVVMKAQATEEQVHSVCQKIEKLGYRAHPMPGATRTAIGITGNKGEVEQGTLTSMMFMIPMPPTSKLTAATAPSSVVI